MLYEEKTRKTYLDAMRIFAAFLVVFNHAEGFHLFMTQEADGSIASWLRVMVSVLTKINVPLFYMISGALLLGREESYALLFRKRIARFLAVLLLFSAVLYAVDNPGNYDAIEFVYALFHGDVNLSYWFLYAYLGFLFALPFLRKIAGRLRFADIVFLFVLRGYFYSVIPICRYWEQLHGIAPLILRSDFSLPFSAYDILFYPLVGYYAANVLPLEKLGRKELAACVAVLLGGTMISSVVTYHEGICGEFTQNYLGLFTYSSTAAVFLIARYAFSHISIKPGIGRVLAVAGSLTFGVYLLEPLLNRKFYYAFGESLDRMLYSLVWCCFALLACGGITFVLKRLPLMRKLL